ncbi:MAG TPA: hypothetical protein VKT82_09980 [Ktedonobacterales bacterium]|nr:hypothetical protein [Ktedonobacterales bacterium]
MSLLRTINHNKLNLFLDMFLVLAFVVEMEEGFTGQRYHEYLGVGITVVFAVHIALHWRWVVNVSKHIIRRMLSLPGLSFKYCLNVIVLLDLAFSIITGILISNTLGFYLPINGQVYETLRYLHIGSSRLSLLLIGLHIAVDWKWIVASSKKNLFSFGFPGAKSHTVDLEETL